MISPDLIKNFEASKANEIHAARTAFMRPGLQTSLLNGTFAYKNNKTTLNHRYHTAPLKISKTFSLEDELMVYIMDASPGILDGDTYEMNWTLEPHSKVILTNQSSTKVHPTPKMGSQLLQNFHIGQDSILQLFPEPLVPYRGSRFQSKTHINMDSSSILMYADITTPGRIHQNELFDYDELSLKLDIYRDQKLEAWEHFHLKPSIHNSSSSSAFDGFSHMGVFWLIAPRIEADLFQFIRDKAMEQTDLLIGCSRSASQGIVLRMLGHNVWRLQQVIHSIWSLCRSHLMNRDPIQMRK